ncbi:hypothetical protein GCM10020331_010980 [Ectobacillus funiculus]
MFPAVLIPFKDDYSIDEQGFRALVRWVASHEGVSGIVVNGHTGEIMTLLPEERAEAVRIAADELKRPHPCYFWGICRRNNRSDPTRASC